MDRTDDPALARGFRLLEQGWLPQPDGLVSGPAAADLIEAGVALPLPGGRSAFTLCRLHPPPGVGATPVPMPITQMCSRARDLLPAAFRVSERPAFAGLDLRQPRLMGIVNVTPDSFSDGGRHFATEAAVAHGLSLRDGGADILDVGGESTRPGAEPVPVEEELRRVVPVVRALAAAGGARVSIDTRHAPVMRAAIAAGADIVNDVSALEHDPDSVAAVAESGVAVVLMHMQGEPRTMQASPRYIHAPTEVYDHLARRIDACTGAGIGRDRIAVDPGIGFGKTLDHNLALLDALPMLQGLGCAVLLGVSRKGFLGRLGGGAVAAERTGASIAAGLRGITCGADILRVHDVPETARALAVWSGLHLRFRVDD